uniref:Uncharacterized protein n=1 Tax=Solanum tuberosum TaxID=4113 RepID=M1DH51_SOLTU
MPIYGFLDPDIEAFTTMNCESGSWLALKLCPRINVPWAITKAKILFSDLTNEARIWILFHRKIKKREKSRDMFYTWIWKGVKGLWNVLKANDPLPTSRSDEVVGEPAPWSDNERAQDIEATESVED